MSTHKPYMATLFFFYFLDFVITSQILCSTTNTLSIGSSLSVEKPDADVLTSPNGIFSAGFQPVGKNAYCFSVWFNDSPNQENRTIVWMANRDKPVNGKGSKLSLLKTNNLILTESTGRNIVWNTGTSSSSVAHLQLHNSGNVVLHASDGEVLWQNFDSPTDTLLPLQPLTRYTNLLSSRSQGNFSSGFYKFFFDTDNLLRLVYDGIQLTSVYWPSPWLVSWEAGRSTNNNTKIAVLDSLGNFSSSDDFTFMSAEYGAKNQRRLKIDYDGNLRLYTRSNSSENWVVSWQAFSNPCKIHGICGSNSLCTYSENSGRKCSCIPGHKMKNHTDWSYGCEPEFKLSCGKDESDFLKISNTEFYGYDYGCYHNYTMKQCKDLCLELCKICVGFQYSYSIEFKDQFTFNCCPKLLLANGVKSPKFFGDIYLRLPRNYSSHSQESGFMSCAKHGTILLPRTYKKSHENELVKFILWFVTGVGGFEILCVLLVWGFLWARSSQRNSSENHMREHLLAATGFKRFSFSELKKATQGFSNEIGRGAGGIVYKGVLADTRVAAIKRLSEAFQGKAEFLAEVNTIGRLNHMNLIDMWGYCFEGKHRLLVYEYMEKGSLADNLRCSTSNNVVLDWEKRFAIAMGTAKGLAYLHEECLEWVLHCDVKPQNILLDSNYNPKVADFGLSKLLKRGDLHNSSFSKIRGTRGYMAPEWVYNLPITSKVDVYSFGIVVLEMVTGKKRLFDGGSGGDGGSGRIVGQERLVTWVREKMKDSANSWIEEIVDPMIEGQVCDRVKMELLVKVALQCVEKDKEARPTMRKVVEMLQCDEDQRALLFNLFNTS